MVEDITDINDESLMERVQQHDHQAFSILVDRHSKKFYVSSYRIVMNKEEAEDVVQEAFLKLWDRPNVWKVGKGAKFTSWFYKIVMNLSIDKYRKSKKLDVIEDQETYFEIAAEQHSNLQRSDEQAALDKALKSLPEKQLLALNLCFYEEKSRKEAAELMKVSVKAMESLLMRAKQGLKNDLNRQGFVQEISNEEATA